MADRGMRFSALVVAVSCSFLTPFMASSVNIALPAIQQNFGTDAVLLSWVSTGYLLATAVSLVPFGRLGDIYGRKRIFIYGMMIFIISSVLAALSVSTLMLIISRVFEGWESQALPYLLGGKARWNIRFLKSPCPGAGSEIKVSPIVPIHQWFRGDMKQLLRDYLSVDRLRKEGLFDPGMVETMVGEHLSGAVNHWYRLWALLMWEMWRERWS